MSFRAVFIAVIIATGMIVSAVLLNQRRPPVGLAQPSPDFIRATGKCAACHSKETPAVVHQFELSAHAREGVSCLDCHRPSENQDQLEFFRRLRELA